MDAKKRALVVILKGKGESKASKEEGEGVLMQLIHKLLNKK